MTIAAARRQSMGKLGTSMLNRTADYFRSHQAFDHIQEVFVTQKIE